MMTAYLLIIFKDNVNQYTADVYSKESGMVAELRLKGMPGKRGLMFVPYYGRSRAFISNYRSWQEYYGEGRIAEIATSLISHETLHLTLNKFSFITSAKLDNLFGRSNKWEDYPHGLGDLHGIKHNSPVTSKSSIKIAAKKRKKYKFRVGNT
jgi:hypothetical protein